MKKSVGRVRVRKSPVPPAPPIVDQETRAAFVQGVGVPRPHMDSDAAARLARQTREIPVQRDGSFMVPYRRGDPSPEAVPGASEMPKVTRSALALLSDAAARELEPTAPESVAAQCDGLARLADRLAPRLAGLRSLFVIDRLGPSKMALTDNIAALEDLAAQAVQLRNCLAIYAADL